MALKQVVLPAPFGPMSPRISPRRISNDTPSRATTPPNRSVTSSRESSTSSVAAGVSAGPVVWVSDMCSPLLELLELFVGLPGTDGPLRRQESLRSEVGQHDQQDAEDQ